MDNPKELQVTDEVETNENIEKKSVDEMSEHVSANAVNRGPVSPSETRVARPPIRLS